MDISPTTTHGTLLAVDGHSLAFRAFFALPVENFTTKEGQPTNAVYGFLTMLAQVIEAEHPNRIGIAFDVKGGTFRNELLGQYKGTREAAPQELLSQLPLIQQALEALGVRYVEQPGYEGDDVIATLATMGEQAGYKTLVLSGDRDAFQLIDDHITVLYPGYHFKDLKHMDPQAVLDKYHVTPQQYPDLAALRGETADNIPGVPASAMASPPNGSTSLAAWRASLRMPMRLAARKVRRCATTSSRSNSTARSTRLCATSTWAWACRTSPSATCIRICWKRCSASWNSAAARVPDC